MHACVYVFPGVTLKCSVILGCRLSENSQLGVISNLVLLTMLKVLVSSRVTVKLAEKMFMLEFRLFLIRSDEGVIQKAAHEWYGVMCAPHASGRSAAIPLNTDLGSTAQISYRGLGESPKQKQGG